MKLTFGKDELGFEEVQFPNTKWVLFHFDRYICHFSVRFFNFFGKCTSMNSFCRFDDESFQ